MIDVREKEKDYAKKKLRHKYDMIEAEARNLLNSNKVITSMIKCTQRLNHCELQDAMINNDMVEESYSRCK